VAHPGAKQVDTEPRATQATTMLPLRWAMTALSAVRNTSENPKSDSSCRTTRAGAAPRNVVPDDIARRPGVLDTDKAKPRTSPWVEEAT